MTKIPSGEVILRAIHGWSASDGNRCDIESNAGDFSIGYQNNIGDSVRIDQANEEGTLSNGQTDIELHQFKLRQTHWIHPDGYCHRIPQKIFLSINWHIRRICKKMYRKIQNKTHPHLILRWKEVISQLDNFRGIPVGLFSLTSNYSRDSMIWTNGMAAPFIRQAHGELAIINARAKSPSSWITTCLYDHEKGKGGAAHRDMNRSYLMADIGPANIFLYNTSIIKLVGVFHKVDRDFLLHRRWGHTL